ncbi:bifunctional isopimaradiene synthase, chloroplastic-like [Zingiber officinale]|uniref:Uncharacterized protein n=1 Tax=Zingiber officinale TaxID=94328 RepID=A0A8J5KQL6_ZINOF|nr:bifunctional isopimaradiene synthase, chloroplastic-like [Zingiber officinale]XP_042422647.1 bifunctional isopimaradiene synthase, chloroplastic-like [Zingiber officinale]KAG6488057.1 hypothetical protein ZIOFF_056815 [Zingiber officinale]KAG6488059.1 hypothetical protein ZIOFF_056817 [Zingiber officinale]
MEGLCQLPSASRSLISSRRSSAAVRISNGGASFGQGSQTLAIQSQSKRRARNISLRATQSPQIELLKKGSDRLPAIPAEKDEAKNERWETLVKEIKQIFRLMDDGETNASAYDTAWVARIPSTEDSSKPHFPQTIDWILKNQLEDGSWGEPTYYLVFDRLVCTLACVLALKTWNIAEDQIEKGLNYLKNHVDEIETASESLITSGFEIAFPSMLNEAKNMGIDLPYDRPSIQKIIKFREKKMSRIPVKVMHSVHTTLLYTLEALQEVVQWDEILKLQSADGSFLSSASSTAAVYMNTGDKKCLEFLQSVLNRFGDNLPCQYPIDLFERIWAIDTIARLGIDHLFKKEIIDTLDYVYKYSGKQGVSWGRDNTVPDVDDTCMALRLMRLYGYPVSSDMIEFFRDDDGNFICFPGQTHRGVSDMFNLYRFSQVAFPGEKVLKEANAFVESYLKDCVKNNKVDDKWSCKKALGKEVARGLEYPWRRSFPRLDAREYLDHYGDNDVWLAKTIYLIYNVTNPKYLELAKLEFNRLQAIYEKEIGSVVEWWNSCGLEATSLSPEQLHFAIASTLPEPEFARSRIAYTKSNSIENVLVDLFYKHESTEDLKNLCRAVEEWNPSLALSLPSQLKTTFNVLYETLNELAGEASKVQGKDVFPYFHELRKKQMEMYMKLRESKLGGQSGEYSLKDYIEHGKTELGVAVRLLPSVFLMGERLRDLDLLCLNEKSRIQEKLSVFLRLYVDLQMHKNSLAQGGMNAVAVSMEEGKRREEEALGDVEAQMEEAFDELVHESLKPSLVPRSCRRLMFEHARITQFFLHDDFTSPAHRRKIADAIERFRTPVPIDRTE